MLLNLCNIVWSGGKIVRKTLSLSLLPYTYKAEHVLISEYCKIDALKGCGDMLVQYYLISTPVPYPKPDCKNHNS